MKKWQIVLPQTIHFGPDLLELFPNVEQQSLMITDDIAMQV